MAFEIKSESFEGPLDLMLHLIKENKLDLFDLDMNVLCDQYLHYINAMESMHLEVASEFLSELAGLIEYKSKKMLPKEKAEITEEYEEDQREKLVKRLLEYQRFKEVSQEFSKKYEERQKLMSKPMSEKTSEWVNTLKEEDFVGNPYDLIKAMNRVIRRMSLEIVQETVMHVSEMSVEERDEQIRNRFAAINTKISFEDLCDDCD
ncbi:MAG: chromosome segregation protein ScpA, partial [Erysipelotrichia bacterium]|nr:chromosome segregation protein ScpA [Erysipelotrichia bacterium]